MASRPSRPPACGIASADVILNILAPNQAPAPSGPVQTPESLRLEHAPLADCARYDNLRSRVVEETALEWHEILDMLGTLQLSGMRAAYDEIVPNGVKRQHSFERIFASLIKAEIAEKHARSISYQLGIAKLPLAKGHPDQRRAGEGSGRRRIPRASAQCSADRWHRFRQEPPGDRHQQELHPRRRQGALLQCGRSRQQVRGACP